MNKYVDAIIDFLNFACYEQGQKTLLSVSIKLFSQQQSRYFGQLNKMQN